ncbi:MAG: paraslipin, partial [Planctomycetes bacterium]|nr:paraslipin [Planctomycetota bacterium]
MTTFFLVLLIAIIIIFKAAIIFVPNHVIVIQQRLGKYHKTLPPGFHILIPLMDRAAYTHEIREQVLDVPSQSCITRDNIEVEVDGLVYIKVIDAKRASYEISSYRNASVNLAQTTMRSEIGKMDLDSTFSERENLNSNIVKEIDKASDSWGIKVLRYEIRNITPSRRIIETMEK